MDGYRKDLDFVEFIFDRGREFEAGILRLFRERYEVTTIAQDFTEIRRQDKAEETFGALKDAAPIIYQAVLWDADSTTYSSPDFLVRSDVLHNLFPESFSLEESIVGAPDLEADNWHYLVVDTKFTTLHLNAGSTEVDNSGSAPAYKVQLYIYNRTLGRLQGFEPPKSYLLGRGWQRKEAGATHRCSNAMELLGPIPQNGSLANGVIIAEAVEDALGWVRKVRADGAAWQLLPEPTVPELYPNMSNAGDADLMLDIGPADLEPSLDDEGPESQWTGVKKWLASELKELTQLWQVGIRRRREAHAAGIYRWDAPDITPEAIGIKGVKQAPTLAQILAVNIGGGGPVLPDQISNTREEWHVARGVEFYVDFEFCSDLNDDFSKLPEKGARL